MDEIHTPELSDTTINNVVRINCCWIWFYALAAMVMGLELHLLRSYGSGKLISIDRKVVFQKTF